MKVRFMTGEMAQLHGISKQTLIHYDKIGLLSPAEVDSDTEYRYYALEQFEDLELILILKDLGMQLKEIKAYRDQTTAEARLGLLESQREVVGQKVQQFKKIQKRLETMVGKIRNNIQVQPFSKGMKWIEECKQYSIKVPPPYDHFQMELSIKEMFQYMADKRDIDIHDFLFVIKKSSEKIELFEKVSIPMNEGFNEVIPRGYYAYIYHQGPFEALAKTRQQLEIYIQDSGYSSVGNFIEKVLLSGLEVADENEYLVEVLIQIEAQGADV